MTNHISFRLQIFKIPVCKQGFLPFQIFINVNLYLYITHTPYICPASAVPWDLESLEIDMQWVEVRSVVKHITLHRAEHGVTWFRRAEV